ncbi:MAG TPA: hypothetical protein VI685_12895 [Candidatus Angelobacter sp.]
MRLLRAIGLTVLVLAALVRAGDKKNGQLYSKPGQTADVEIRKLVTARQSCENWAVAAGLETMLRQQDVALDQNFWVVRISGGEICAPALPSLDVLNDVVNHDFTLEDGRHVRLELHYIPGAPVDVDAVIAGLKRQQLSLLLLRGHLYYLTGVTYDESVNRDGTRFFVISELRLANTYSNQPGLAFTKGRNSMDDIGGILTVSVTPTNQR